MIRPVAAEIVYSDGKRHVVSADHVEALHDAVESLVTRRSGGYFNAADEGSELGSKPLRYIGGRTEFERSTQRELLAWLKAHERPELPRVLLIGDSIRMRINNGTGYGIYAYRKLIDRVNLTHIPHNCGGTRGVIDNLADWIQEKPDVVHLNAGLHDLSRHRSPDVELPMFSSIPKYQKNLRRIFDELRKAGVPKIIWALNTPVDDEWHKTSTRGAPRSLVRRNEDVIAYNQASIDVAAEYGIPVNDLFSPLMEMGVRKAVLPDGVHLSHHGAALAGSLVADMIIKTLGERSAKD